MHVDDVAEAVLRALVTDIEGHIRLTLCGPGDFDTSLAERTLGWKATRGWPS